MRDLPSKYNLCFEIHITHKFLVLLVFSVNSLLYGHPHFRPSLIFGYFCCIFLYFMFNLQLLPHIKYTTNFSKVFTTFCLEIGLNWQSLCNKLCKGDFVTSPLSQWGAWIHAITWYWYYIWTAKPHFDSL